MASYIGRRKFLAALGGAAAAWFPPALYVLWFRVKEPVAAESAVAEQVAV